MDWTSGLDWWAGLVDCTGGLDWWTRMVDWFQKSLLWSANENSPVGLHFET